MQSLWPQVPCPLPTSPAPPASISTSPAEALKSATSWNPCAAASRFFDYDNDGWMDIFLVNGSTLEDSRSGKCHPGKLYHNNHDGTFTDVSAKAGITRCGWGFGVAVGDYDNDGWEDLYITYLDGAALYHNNHDGSFTDVTEKAGVGNAGRWGTSAAFGDYDNDGNLDLYVADYVDLDLNHLPEFGQGPFCTYRGIAVSCGPRGLKGGRDRLYHNNGDGTFTDVTEKLNIDPDSYYGLGVLWLDYDLDGCLDLYVANDSSPSLLYHNDCKGGFTEVGAEVGSRLQRGRTRASRHGHRFRRLRSRRLARHRQNQFLRRHQQPLSQRSRRPVHRPRGKHRLWPGQRPLPGLRGKVSRLRQRRLA